MTFKNPTIISKQVSRHTNLIKKSQGLIKMHHNYYLHVSLSSGQELVSTVTTYITETIYQDTILCRAAGK